MRPPFKFGIRDLEKIANHLRLKVFEVCREARSGHVGASSGAVELFTTLYFSGVLRFDPADPNHPDRDRVLVRGHVGPLRYPLFACLGWLDEHELLTYRRLGSRLHGHEDHKETPGVDLTPSGSLGMILSFGVGCALSAHHRDKNYTTYVFLGDGEEQEGNVSEAARHAAHLRLSNLIVVLDRNAKQLSDPTAHIDSADVPGLWQSYGWQVLHVRNGNDVSSLLDAWSEVHHTQVTTHGPVLLVVDTLKGAGLEGCSRHFSGYHTMSVCPLEVIDQGIKGMASLDCDLPEDLLSAIAVNRQSVGTVAQEGTFSPVDLDIRANEITPNHPDFCQTEYFERLKQAHAADIFADGHLYFLTADVTRQDQVKALGLRDYFHYYNVGIREQHSVALAHGISLADPAARIIINSFDAFNFRCFDQINAAVQGRSSMTIIGDIAGLTNSRNGRTHQTVGQPGAALMLPGLTFLEPWDAVDTFNCLNWAIGQSRGVVYLRVHSSGIPDECRVALPRNLTFYTVTKVDDPDVVIVASGMTVTSSLQASHELRRKGISVRVINVVNPKSLDRRFVALVPVNCPVVTVYNGNPEVLESAVARALYRSECGWNAKSLSLGYSLGTTGELLDLMRHFGLDAHGVLEAVQKVL